MAERFLLGAKEVTERERRHRNLSAHSGDDTVVVVMCTVLSKMYMRYVIVASEMHLHDMASDA